MQTIDEAMATFTPSQFQLDEQQVRSYLEARFGQSARVLGLSILGQESGAHALKGYGYGTPVRVDYELDGQRRTAVLETVTPGPFGHEHMADRAQILLWSHGAFNRLPRHVRSLDVGGFDRSGALRSLGDVEEFFMLNEFAPGEGYNRDLERLRDGGRLGDGDLARADALCDYLAEIHRVRGPDRSLYVRRTRELVGHHECIMGILDAYSPARDGPTADMLKAIEHACIDWRWRLKKYAHRLSQVHGDFHPWNILFQNGATFVVLDRSRGEWGDPADDVTALTINYLFFSLQQSGSLDGSFATLFSRFWARYLNATGDRELLEVAGPFFAFRGLVVANPLWYPNLLPEVRTKLLTFVRTVLDEPRFDPSSVNEYCECGAGVL
jgi:hypothetical protein